MNDSLIILIVILFSLATCGLLAVCHHLMED